MRPMMNATKERDVVSWTGYVRKEKCRTGRTDDANPNYRAKGDMVFTTRSSSGGWTGSWRQSKRRKDGCHYLVKRMEKTSVSGGWSVE